jgi:hypothetical protein
MAVSKTGYWKQVNQVASRNKLNLCDLPGLDQYYRPAEHTFSFLRSFQPMMAT